jgi:SNF2 family DNA or RNA helicase
VHTVRVRLSADEMRMHALLARYSAAVRADRERHAQDDEMQRDAWLALSVLHKRALSSAWSLAQSVERRLSDLSGPPDAAGIQQLALPLGDPDGERVAADEAPVWPADLRLSDAARERRLLTALAACARTASNREAKLAALCKLLRRANQSAVVFTEYRDTLRHIATRLPRPALLLHGGLSREERASALAEFARRPGALLLATDAAAEGLNLHRGCRLVVNVELPWNPMRLEQRIGRVDRIGQRRTVHAFHLIAEDTSETRILARLRARIAVAQADIGAPNPLGGDDERDITTLVIRGDAHHDDHNDGSPGRSDR